MKKISGLFFILFLSGVTVYAVAGPRHIMAPCTGDPTVTEVGDFHLVQIPEGCYLPRPGYPELPVIAQRRPLPPGYIAQGVVIDRIQYELIPGQIIPRPQPAPRILSMPIGNDLPVEPAPVYEGVEPFPSEAVILTGMIWDGERFQAEILISPFRFHAREKSLEKLTVLEYHFELAPDSNPGLLSPHRSSMVPVSGSVEYLIISSEETRSAFQRLADWKTRKGVSAEVVTVESILAASPGRDDPEKIRNYIRVRVGDSGVRYVLLGGYFRTIPLRYAWAMDCEAGQNDLGADLYYADLDGDWDADGDGIFGEVEDDVDLNPDIYVGRAPVYDAEEAEGFVDKVLRYEMDPREGFATESLFLAEVLWNDPFTDAAIHKDIIDTCYVPEQFDPITKLYETLNNTGETAVFMALDAGGHLCNHDGHGMQYGWGVGTGFLTNGSIQLLNNINRPWVVFSIGCLTAQMNRRRTIATDFVTNTHGGAVAYMGNFSYGWGLPGNPGFGYSDVFDSRFFEFLFDAESPRLGEILFKAKSYYLPLSREANVYRWIQYQLNLLGDPEMPIWTDEPRTLNVNAPDTVSSSCTEAPVHVFTDGAALVNARVCLFRPDECFEVGYTSETGAVTLPMPGNLTGPVSLTVTAHNVRPFLKEITLNDQPDLGISEIVLTDTDTSASDNIPEPGEQFILSPILANSGSFAAESVTAILSCDSPDIAITTGTADYGTIGGGESTGPISPFQVSISEDITPHRSVPFTLVLTFGEVQQTLRFHFMVASPHLQFTEMVVYDFYPDGDADGVLEPGESAYINFVFENTGGAHARNPRITLTSDSPWIQLLTDTIVSPQFGPGEMWSGYDRVLVHASADAPLPGCGSAVIIRYQMDGIPETTETVIIPIGNNGIIDDFETGAGQWTLTGENNLWHLSDFRTMSGSAAWYCGDENTREYDLEMVCSLVSPEFFLTPGSELTFSRWFDFPMYGTDGVFVEIDTGGGWETLHFIGGGGALNLQSDWQRETLSLPGENCTARIRFRAVAEGMEVAEGFYLDDIAVTCPTGCAWSQEPWPTTDPGPGSTFDGITLFMPSGYFSGGTPCQLLAWVFNTSDMTRNLNLYVVLDVFGNYFFAPAWTGAAASSPISVAPGRTEIEILAEFPWPHGTGTATGILFWGAVLDPATGVIFGQLDRFAFGWHAP